MLVEGEKIGIRAALEQAKIAYPALADDLEDAAQEIEEDTFLWCNEDALEGEFELSEKSKQAMFDALEKFRESC